MRKSILVASGFVAGIVLMVACSDEVTKVTNVSENASVDSVKEFEALPKCEEDVEGTLIYVKDSAKVYGCTSDGWIQVNGKDGEKGAKGDKGEKGADGENGTSCTAKQTKDKTGIDIVCGGKTVGTVKNGENGEDGKKGDDGEKGDDGKNGTSCTAKANKDKTGFEITCDGKSVGTIKNGEDGEDGDACTLTEGENGQVSVKCGEESVTLFKASCGTGSYDPATQFCANDLNVYPLCHKTLEGFEQSLNADGTYDVKSYFCDVTDLLVPLCKAKTYDFTTQFCDNHLIFSRCDSIAEGLAENVLKEGGQYNSIDYFCSEKGVLYEKCAGNSYDPDLQFCDRSEENPQVVAKCGGQTYEIKTEKCVDGLVESAIACCIKEGQNDKWCEDHPNSLYDIRSQFCDTRDGQPYKFTEITVKGDSGKVVYSETWMAQNLNYAGTEESESDCFGGISSNCDADGRLYTWDAAVNYCPDGWDLPSKQQFTDLFEAVNKYGVSYSFLGQHAGFYGPQGWEGHGVHLLMWTSEECTDDVSKAWRIDIKDGSYTDLVINPKTNLESVICIKHK